MRRNRASSLSAFLQTGRITWNWDRGRDRQPHVRVSVPFPGRCLITDSDRHVADLRRTYRWVSHSVGCFGGSSQFSRYLGSV